MDIIASHRQGLLETIDAEARALAGRGGDWVQRAIVYHHLYQHSAGRAGHALVAAHRSLALAEFLERADRAARRRTWRLGRGKAAALQSFTTWRDAIADQAAAECAAAYAAYRIQTHPTLGPEFAAPSGLAERAMIGDLRDWPAMTRWIARSRLPLRFGGRTMLSASSAEVDQVLVSRAATWGWDRVEARLAAYRRLPRTYLHNPGRHFFAIRGAVIDRLRQQRWNEDAVEDDFAIAA